MSEMNICEWPDYLLRIYGCRQVVSNPSDVGPQMEIGVLK